MAKERGINAIKEKVLSKKYLVTSGLPYANGKLHIGHVAGAYLPADIFVRFRKLKEDDVIYICGTDEHGAPISIKAEAEGIEPQKLVQHYHNSIKNSFDGIGIQFDNFSGTARPEHVKLSQKFFLNLLERGFIKQKTTEQFFDEKHKRFLPDRYVEGICPYCKAEDARGDQCDSCGKLLNPTDLIKPKSKISGATPVLKETTHWYLELPKFENKLRKWLQTKTDWKENVYNFIMSWLNEGLIERAISRDIDWGVPIPLENAAGKVLYVWFDAPIGYISATMEWAKNIGEPEKWKDYWLDENTRLIHFIGKDNIPFHTIIWPAMLMEQDEDYVLPTDVPANEYLNLEGRKMSTSKNWTVWVDDFLEDFDGEYLRYYLAAIAPETKDSDFSWKDFQNKINNDLANILGNLANRVFSFTKKYYDSKIPKPQKLCNNSKILLEETDELLLEIEKAYENYQVRKAVRLIVDMGRLGNRYFDENRPWKAVKQDKDSAAETLYICSELLRRISIVFSPVLPKKMKMLRQMLNLKTDFTIKDLSNQLGDIQIGEISPLFPKIDDKKVRKQLDKLAVAAQQANPKPQIEHKPQVEFADFEKLEIRVVKVIEAEKIKKSNKLLKLKIDIGGEERTVVSGISKFYKPEDIMGKKVAMVLNVKPRKIMGINSEAMILAAKTDDKMKIVVPEGDIDSGSEIS
ncbi:MAG: methionyl-tRNA synthetase [Candidatus Cloacimonadota bacterium]|jgi:methionyl-tRNA synthetase|nr:methionyl-tRNA synthetase [Candidatus Cloacimonadota bacterium]